MTSPGLLSRILSLACVWCALFAVLLHFTPPAQAQERAGGSVAGRVYNPATDSYVRNVEIQVQGTTLTTLSTDGGYYRFDELAPGEVSLVVTYAGARPRTYTATVVAGGVTRLGLELLDETQSRTGADGEVVMLETFTVSGEREGNAKAFAEQKNAMNMKNVVAADTFGDNTEGNVAEFLQFLPGVTVDYSGDDARAVRVRGLDPKYVGVTMDGVRMASSSSSDPSLARQFEFEQFSINAIETIEVNKTLTAEHEADSPAGVINMRSKSALDRKGRRVSWQVNVSGSQHDLSLGQSAGPGDDYHNKIRPGGRIDFSDIYLGGKLGVLLTANVSNVFVHGESYLNPYLYNSPGLPVVATREVRYSTSEKLGKRKGASLGLDYQASDALRLSFRTQWSDIVTAAHVRTLRLYSVVSALNPSSTLTRIQSNASTITVDGAGSNKTGETISLTPSFRYTKDQIELDGSIGYSVSKNAYRDLADGFFIEATQRMGSEPLVMTRADTGSTEWDVTTNRDLFSLASYRNSSNGNVSSRPRDAEQEQLSGALNFKWAARWENPTHFKVGMHYREMSHRLQRYTENYTFRGADGTVNTPDDYFSNYPSPYMLRTDFGGSLFSGQRAIELADRSQLATAYREHPEWFTQSNAQKGDAYDYWLRNYTNYKEEVPAGYFMASTRIGRLSLQAGLRYEDTTSRSEVLPEPLSGPAMTAAFPGLAEGTVDYIKAQYNGGVRKWITTKYDDVFLSGGARWAFTKNLIARLGFSQAIHRPELNNLSRAPSVNDDTMLVTLPNPGLKPEYSDNFSAELEYYMPKVGKLAVSVFRNNITDVQYLSADLSAEQVGVDPAQYPAGYFYRTTLNGERLTVHGFELEYRQSLTFLPGVFKNLGVFATYSRTYFDNEVYAGEISPSAATGGMWFDYRRLSLSAKGTWTDDTFDAAGASGEIRRRMDRMYVDVEASFDLRYKRSKFRQRFFISGRNILDEPTSVYSNEPGRLYSKSTRGVTWTAGIKGTF